MGLADPNVYLLDPASGTGTFLFFVIRVIHDYLMERGQGGNWEDYVHTKLLPRIFGFELLMAPYVIAHLKLSLLLKDLGYTWGRDDRLRVYLTNTLDEGRLREETLDTLGWYISEEGSEAAKVKSQVPIMVVLGNPPYSVHSANASKSTDGHLNFIGKLLRDYYFVDGHPLDERNPKSLQDDYVKFIRFAQWRIQQTGHGIVGFITNHGYLDNPTFRGMRQNLMNTFDEIHVVDLHGNINKKERAPDGGKDENIFDIQQGVAILLAIKFPAEHKYSNNPNKQSPQVYHSQLWGLRKYKYSVLASQNVNEMEWTELKPEPPFYLFSPQNVDLAEEYKNAWSITEIMPIFTSCMNTARDGLVIDVNKEMLLNRIRAIADPSKSTNN